MNEFSLSQFDVADVLRSLIAILILLAALVSSKRLNHIRRFFPTRIAKLTDASKCKKFKGLERKALDEELRNAHFRRATGLRAGKDCRKAILRVINTVEDRIGLGDFREAWPYLRYEQSKLRIRITFIDKVIHYICWYLSLAVCVGGVLMLVVAQISSLSEMEAIALFGLGVIAVISGLFFSWTNIPYFSAQRVRKEIES